MTSVWTFYLHKREYHPDPLRYKRHCWRSLSSLALS